MAAICSAVLAEDATLMPNMFITSIMESMPKVTKPPGKTRVIQSNSMKGTNGSPVILSSRYISPIIGAVSSPPPSAPWAKSRPKLPSVGVVPPGRCSDILGHPPSSANRTAES